MENQNENLEDNLFEKSNNYEKITIINTNKFIVLSIVTFGLYEIWWIYKEWQFFKKKDNLEINPILRAIFSIFFLKSLFTKILSFANQYGYKGNYAPSSLFIGIILTNILVNLPSPYGLISVFSFMFFLPPINALNFAKQNSPDLIVVEQNGFSGKQIALIILGVCFWTLVILGLTIDENSIEN